MRILHTLDNSNRGGIQALIFLLHKHSRHSHEFWAADGSMASEMRAGGMTLWNGGPPETEHYDVVVGHTVGGWSHHDLSGWAHSRGSKIVECMHSIANSPTPEGDLDGFIAMSDLALHRNVHMRKATRIYGICDVTSFAGHSGNAIGRLSRLADEKRPQDFVDIASSFPHEKFLMAGDGPLMRMCQELAPTNLTLVGWITDHPEFYSRLKLFVFPTRDECCSMSLAMAQAAGLPCIVQDIPALHETTGGHAVFANRLPDFNAYVRKFLNNPSEFDEMAQASREWALTHFDVPVTVGAWDDYLSGLGGDYP